MGRCIPGCFPLQKSQGANLPTVFYWLDPSFCGLISTHWVKFQFLTSYILSVGLFDIVNRHISPDILHILWLNPHFWTTPCHSPAKFMYTQHKKKERKRKGERERERKEKHACMSHVSVYIFIRMQMYMYMVRMQMSHSPPAALSGVNRDSLSHVAFAISTKHLISMHGRGGEPQHVCKIYEKNVG